MSRNFVFSWLERYEQNFSLILSNTLSSLSSDQLLLKYLCVTVRERCWDFFSTCFFNWTGDVLYDDGTLYTWYMDQRSTTHKLSRNVYIIIDIQSTCFALINRKLIYWNPIFKYWKILIFISVILYEMVNTSSNFRFANGVINFKLSISPAVTDCKRLYVYSVVDIHAAFNGSLI